MSEATAALKNKLTHHNIKFEITSESPTHAYLIIREENISGFGGIVLILTVYDFYTYPPVTIWDETSAHK